MGKRILLREPQGFKGESSQIYSMPKILLKHLGNSLDNPTPSSLVC